MWNWGLLALVAPLAGAFLAPLSTRGCVGSKLRGHLCLTKAAVLNGEVLAPLPDHEDAANQRTVVLSDWFTEDRGAALVVSSKPHALVGLVASLWEGVSRDGRLSYLASPEQDRIRRGLAFLVAWLALAEHPSGSGAPMRQLFAEMDQDDDGEVTFSEFVQWYHSVPTERPLLPSSPTSFAPAWPPSSSNRAPLESGGFSLDRQSLLAALEQDEAEQRREAWLSSGVGGLNAQRSPATVSYEKASNGASANLERAMQVVDVLLSAHADADTVLAALASEAMRLPGGNEGGSGVSGSDRGLGVAAVDLNAVGEQFGPVVRAIVESRMLLERLASPSGSLATMGTVRQARGVRAVRDLDDRDAKLLREYLVQSASDIRSLVIHMSALVLQLRPSTPVPLAERHHLALEALQLYVPVSNALGLGAAFRELEELSYRAVFPDTYRHVSAWHCGRWSQGVTAMAAARTRLLAELAKDTALAEAAFEVQMRAKCLVSTFRKVFRQNKRVEEVHDMFGLRVIVSPGPTPLQRPAGKAPAANATAKAALQTNITAPLPPTAAALTMDHPASKSAEGSREILNDPMLLKQPEAAATSTGASRAASAAAAMAPPAPPLRAAASSSSALAVYTHRTYPPPYRDADSVLLHRVYDVVRSIFPEEPHRYKNYVDFPRQNGYRSVHTVVRHAESGLALEVQLRTRAMHAHAETGAAAHSLYKGGLASLEDAEQFRSKAGQHVTLPRRPQARFQKEEKEDEVRAPLENTQQRLPSGTAEASALLDCAAVAASAAAAGSVVRDGRAKFVGRPMAEWPAVERRRRGRRRRGRPTLQEVQDAGGLLHLEQQEWH